MITIEVLTHSGGTDTLEVASYNSEKVADELNDNKVHVVVFGDNVYSRIDVKGVRKITESTTD